jgi:hypothetical protein
MNHSMAGILWVEGNIGTAGPRTKGRKNCAQRQTTTPMDSTGVVTVRLPFALISIRKPA